MRIYLKINKLFFKSTITVLLCFNTLIIYGQQPRFVFPVSHSAVIGDIKYSSNSKLLLTEGTDKCTKIWDVKTGILLNTIFTERALNFISNTMQLYYKTSDNSICILDSDLVTRRFIQSPVTNSDVDFFIQKSVNHFKVIYNDSTNMINVWDTLTRKVKKIEACSKDKHIISSGLSPNGNYYFTAADDYYLKVWDTRTWKNFFSFKINQSTPKHPDLSFPYFSFSNEGNYLVTYIISKDYSLENKTIICDLTKQKIMFEEIIHSFLAFNSEADHFAYVDSRNNLVVKNTVTMQDYLNLSTSDGEIGAQIKLGIETQLSFLGNNKYLVLFHKGENLVIDLAQKKRSDKNIPGYIIKKAVTSPNGNYVCGINGDSFGLIDKNLNEIFPRAVKINYDYGWFLNNGNFYYKSQNDLIRYEFKSARSYVAYADATYNEQKKNPFFQDKRVFDYEQVNNNEYRLYRVWHRNQQFDSILIFKEKFKPPLLLVLPHVSDKKMLHVSGRLLILKGYADADYIFNIDYMIKRFLLVELKNHSMLDAVRLDGSTVSFNLLEKGVRWGSGSEKARNFYGPGFALCMGNIYTHGIYERQKNSYSITSSGNSISYITDWRKFESSKFGGDEISIFHTDKAFEKTQIRFKDMPIYDQKAVTVLAAALSGKKPWFAAAISDETIKVWDTKSGEYLFDLEKASGYKLDELFFTADSKYLIGVESSNNPSLLVWDIGTKSLVLKLQLNTVRVSLLAETSINNFCIHPIENKILYHSNDGKIKLYDIGSKKDVLIFNNPTNPLPNYGWLSFSPGGNYLIASGFNSKNLTDELSHMIWNSRNISQTQSIEGNILAFSEGDSFVATANSSFISIYDLNKKNGLFKIVYEDSSSNMTLLPDGNYFAFKNGIRKGYYLTKELNPISFEQLDLKYNRPDLVLTAVAPYRKILIDLYHKAWYNRLQRYNIDTTAANMEYQAPIAEFTDRNILIGGDFSDSVKLKIHAIDSNFSLINLNIWINEVPVLSSKGMPIYRPKNVPLDTTITVHLSTGKNKVELSVLNTNAIESYRTILELNSKPAAAVVSKTWFIGIGVQNYKNISEDDRLKYSISDIREFALALKLKLGNDITIDTLFDDAFNLMELEKLKEKLKQTSIHDRVILFYSGHGILQKTNAKYFLPTTVMSLDAWEKPENEAIPYDVFEELVDNIPARNKLVMLDACHSGNYDQYYEYIIAKDSLDTMSITTTQVVDEIFNYIGRKTGSTIIASSSGLDASEETNEYEHGYFTQSLLNAIKKNKNIKVSDLKDFIFKEQRKLSKGKQEASLRSENKSMNFQVW